MNIFKILILAIITILIITQIYNFFKFENANPFEKINYNLTIAKHNLGKPINFNVTIKKNTFFKNTDDLIFKNYNKNLTENSFGVIANKNINNLESSIICKPIFGKKIQCVCYLGKNYKEINYNLKLPEFKDAKTYIIDFSGKAYLLEGQNKDYYNLKIIKIFKPKNNKLKLDLNLNGKFTLVFVYEKPPVAKYFVKYITLKQTYQDLAKSCVATYKETKYDPIEEKNITYFYCQNCLFAEMCRDKWKEKGYNVEAYDVNKAISYD